MSNSQRPETIKATAETVVRNSLTEVPAEGSSLPRAWAPGTAFRPSRHLSKMPGGQQGFRASVWETSGPAPVQSKEHHRHLHRRQLSWEVGHSGVAQAAGLRSWKALLSSFTLPSLSLAPSLSRHPSW